MGELRAAVYARAASDHIPVANQLAALRGQVAADELRVPTEREFVDGGFSGATLARPGLERLRPGLEPEGQREVGAHGATHQTLAAPRSNLSSGSVNAAAA